MSSYCIAWNNSELATAREEYAQIFRSYAKWYDQFHQYIYRLLCIIGVLANIAIVTVLLRPTMRKNPFNLFLIAIALCDMTLMASYFIYYEIELCHPWFFSYIWMVFTYFYAVMSVFVHSSSLWLTVNMAVLRYLVLKYNSRSNSSIQFNSYKYATISIIIAIGISLIGSAPNMLRYEIKYNGIVPIPKQCLYHNKYSKNYNNESTVEAYYLGQPNFWNCPFERISFWTVGIVLKVIPCILLTLFMALLVRMLVEAKNRRNRLSGSGISSNSNGLKNKSSFKSNNGKTQAERTTTMLVLIVLCTMITELPQGIFAVIVGLEPAFSGAAQVLGNFTDLLSLLNSSVNFILYSTMSNLFRTEFLNAFRECFPWQKLFKNNNITNNSDKLNCNNNRSIKTITTLSKNNDNNLQQQTCTTTTVINGISNQSNTTIKNHHLLRSPKLIDQKHEQQVLLINDKNYDEYDDDDECYADENV